MLLGRARTQSQAAKAADAKAATKAHRSFPLELTACYTNPGRNDNNTQGDKLSLVPNVNFGHVRSDEEQFRICQKRDRPESLPDVMRFVRLHSRQTRLDRSPLISPHPPSAPCYTDLAPRADRHADEEKHNLAQTPGPRS